MRQKKDVLGAAHQFYGKSKDQSSRKSIPSLLAANKRRLEASTKTAMPVLTFADRDYITSLRTFGNKKE